MSRNAPRGGPGSNQHAVKGTPKPPTTPPTAAHATATATAGTATTDPFATQPDNPGTFAANPYFDVDDQDDIDEALDYATYTAVADWDATELVDPRDLRHTQDTLDPALVDAYATDPGDVPIEVVRHAGRDYVFDGHHRAAAARQAGNRPIPVVRRTDVDE